MKVIDITEKLNYTEKPRIKIGDTEISINNSAVVMLRIMPRLNKSQMSPDDIMYIVERLISADDMAKLEALELSLEDFMIFIESAAELIAGGSEGEAQTRTTT